MNKSLIKQVIVEQREEIDSIFGREKIIERDLDIVPALAHPNIVFVTGARRAGKSLLAILSAAKTAYAYINFDDERLQAGRDDLDTILECFHELHPGFKVMILDEIQNVPGWELFVSRMRRTRKVIVTGSNARLLSQDLSTHLAGRHIDFVLYPFSFQEHLRLRGEAVPEHGVFTPARKAEMRREFAEYLQIGGFPEVHKFGRSILKSLYDDVLFKDIIVRFKIRKAAAFRDLARILASQYARQFTYARLKEAARLRDVHTARKYVDYLLASHLFFTVERYSAKIRGQILSPRKIYAVDTGLIQLIAFRTSEDRGWLYENCVAIEILRREHYFGGPKAFIWKGSAGEEVDFCLKDQTHVRELIQVCAELGRPGRDGAGRREFDALVKAGSELRCDALTILTDDEEGQEKVAGKTIRVRPIWNWLLDSKRGKAVGPLG